MPAEIAADRGPFPPANHLRPLYILLYQRSSKGNLGSPDEADEDGASQPDLSEIQMNFDLEEDEMKIFSEDEAMIMTESAVSISEAADKSPLAEECKPLPKDQQGGIIIDI